VAVNEHTRVFTSLGRPTTVPICFGHHNCSHNQHLALRNRVLGVTPKPTAQAVAVLKSVARRLAAFLPRVATEQFYVQANRYSGAKRALMVRATDRLIAWGWSDKYAAIRMFVKFELLNPGLFNSAGELLGKKNPDPRAIQYRTAEYCMAISRFLKPCEHALYELQGDGVSLPPDRMVAKGLSLGSRAMLLRKKMLRFRSPVVMSVDCSRFDKHVSVPLLRIEHLVYHLMNNSKEFAHLLALQLRSRGRSQWFKYVAEGRRMSGDMNTALGNCILMIIMVVASMEILGFTARDYDMLDDGDDCLLISESHNLGLLQSRLPDIFLTFGMTLKIENIAFTMEDVVFCQHRPVQLREGTWRFVCNPQKRMANALSSVKYNLFNVKVYRRQMITVGMCELVCSLGVPILQEYALALIRNASGVKPFKLTASESLFHRVKAEGALMASKFIARVDPLPITAVARESFYKAWGITATEQIEQENNLRAWEINIVAPQTARSVDAATWTMDQCEASDRYRL
jgi:hypothetical protein